MEAKHLRLLDFLPGCCTLEKERFLMTQLICDPVRHKMSCFGKEVIQVAS